jgi:hypothetical protein
MPADKKDKPRQIIGWIGVAATVLFAGLWSYWGIVENFHEGWYSPSVWENIGMLFGQYLLVTIVFCTLALLALRFHRVGLTLFIALGIGAALFFSGGAFSVVWLLIAIPLFLLGLSFFFGRPRPKRLVIALIVGVPLAVILIAGTVGFVRVQQRVDDGDDGIRVVEGNGLTLTFAPRGPGWPEGGVSWQSAQDICAHLNEDGTALMDAPQNIWRLPTIDEAVRCMSLHGQNCGGVWDADKMTATYDMTPDKESPLWDVHSPVIYYWTSEASKNGYAYIIVYHGGIYDKRVDSQYPSISFRAVKDTGL